MEHFPTSARDIESYMIYTHRQLSIQRIHMPCSRRTARLRAERKRSRICKSIRNPSCTLSKLCSFSSAQQMPPPFHHPTPCDATRARLLTKTHRLAGTGGHQRTLYAAPSFSRREIASQHSRRRIPRRPQLLRQLDRVHRVVRLAAGHLVHVIAADAVHAGILDDHRVATGAIVVDVRTVAVGVALGVAGLGAHVLDRRARLLADPHQEHGFNGRQVPSGLRVVAFGDALSVGAVEQVVTHDPAAAFAVGGFG